jgi:hypothetical protein
VLRIARTRDDFIRLVEEALHDTDPATAAVRQAAVASGTWDARAEWVSDLIESILKNRTSQERPLAPAVGKAGASPSS